MKKTFITLMALAAATNLFANPAGESRRYQPEVMSPSAAPEKSALEPDMQMKITDAEARLAHLKKYFNHHGNSIEVVFRSLNNQDSANTDGQYLQEEDFKTLISDAENGVSAVKCIVNNKFVVSSNPQQLGKSTEHWKDPSGALILTKFMTSLGSKSGGGMVTVPYSENVESGIEGVAPTTKQYVAVVASLDWLRGQQNDGKLTKDDGVCYITVE